MNFRGTAVDLPTTDYRRQAVGTEAWYKVDDGTSLGLRWAREEFSVTEDVPLLFPLTGASTAIFLGDSIQDYRAHILGVLIRRVLDLTRGSGPAGYAGRYGR